MVLVCVNVPLVLLRGTEKTFSSSSFSFSSSVPTGRTAAPSLGSTSEWSTHGVSDVFKRLQVCDSCDRAAMEGGGTCDGDVELDQQLRGVGEGDGDEGAATDRGRHVQRLLALGAEATPTQERTPRWQLQTATGSGREGKEKVRGETTDCV